MPREKELYRDTLERIRKRADELYPNKLIYTQQEAARIMGVSRRTLNRVGKDVAEILGYTNPQKAIRDHVDEEDKTLNELFTVNGTKGILINESGLSNKKLVQSRLLN